MAIGKLYGLGVGPGDPELVTIKAARIIKETDIIFAPQSKKGRPSVALKIVQGIIDEREEEPEILQPLFPMTEDAETLDKSWDEVKDDYEAIELEAKREISQMNDIEVNDIKSLENTIEEKYKNIKNGINEDNEEDAKDLYKSAIKIEEISKRNNKNINHELVTLSQDSKSLIKHYYGEAEDDFTNVKNSFELRIENIKNYTEDKWQEFLDLLK